MTLPATGGTWAANLEPTLQPLAVRYWQVTDVLIADYYNANGTVFNLTQPSVGLGSAGLFTPFAADGTIRGDLLINNGGWFYHLGELKEDTTEINPSMTVQETATAQSVRSVRNVLTKLDDKISFTPLEATPLVDYLRYELPLSGGVTPMGTSGYQLARPITDQLQERVVVLLGVDTDGNLRSEVFPRVVGDKKGKTEFQRKNPESLELTYTPMGDPFSQSVMWVCREGKQWRALAAAPVFPNTPTATAVTGAKASIVFTTPTGDSPFTYTVSQQPGGSGAFSASTLSGSPVVGSGNTTLSVSNLTVGTTYVFQVKVTDSSGNTTTSSPTASITAIT